MADIFVSYTSSDRDWAFWIGKELEKLGHTPHIHEWEIDAGGDIPAWMEERIEKADRVLCVVSSVYLTKDYSSWERRSAQWAAQKKRPNFLILVFIEDCQAPVALAHIKRCDLYGVSEGDARALLKAYLTPAAKPEGPVPFPVQGNPVQLPPARSEVVAFPGRKFALSNIPVTVPLHFLGRDETLVDIDAALKRDNGRVAITALHGLRGVGKTTLAAAYAERHRADYRATWWIRAQTEATMRADLVTLGVRLGWVAAGKKEAPALAVVRERLRDEGEGLLLIYDNAIDGASLKPYLPPGGAARVLVTSNALAWRGIAAPVEIRVWPKQVGACFLIARAGRDNERADAEALSEALGGLPLAHEQAAAYCERLGVSLAEYAKRFEAAPAPLLDAAKDAPPEYHDRLTVAKSFALAIDEAAKLHPAAEPLIVYAALLAPEPIPLFLFSEAREKFGEPLAAQLAADGLDEAVAALRAFALVDRETIPDERDPTITTETIRLHRLVRTVSSERRQGEAKEAARLVLIEVTAAVYPRDVWLYPSTWPRARRLDALALDQALSAPPPSAERTVIDILDLLGSYRQMALGDYAAALPYYENALAIAEKAFGPEDRRVAGYVNNLAGVIRDLGDLARARLLFERALAIRETALRPEHPDTATSLNNLAGVIQDLGDLARARPLFERALAIREKELGPEHPDTATSLNDLAFLSQEQDDYAGAGPLYERALAIREKALGPENLYTNRTRSLLARLLLSEDAASEALAMSEAALAAHDKVLGANHRWTKASATVTASSLDALDRTDEAAAVRARYGIGGGRG